MPTPKVPWVRSWEIGIEEEGEVRPDIKAEMRENW